MSTADRPAAIGLVRRDIAPAHVDLHELAARHGLRLIFTVFTDSGPLVTSLALSRHAAECDARAVVVPGFEHADLVRHLITENAALITPMRRYPRGHRWPTGTRWTPPSDG